MPKEKEFQDLPELTPKPDSPAKSEAAPFKGFALVLIEGASANLVFPLSGGEYLLKPGEYLPLPEADIEQLVSLYPQYFAKELFS